MSPSNYVGTDTYTLSFDPIGPNDLPRVGGKGANLGALTRAGVRVPPGYCVTTAAFDEFIALLPDADAYFSKLDALDGTDINAARTAAESLRAALKAIEIPTAIREAVIAEWNTLGVEFPLAVRSSATAEDLPGASFAGQQDTYLNIQGETALLDAVRRCWISLYTDRAVLYRARSHFGHRGVRLSVVVQRLIDPDVSGILFTADPVSGHRGTVSIDAGFGLGEALVSGLISADLYRVDRAQRKVTFAQPGAKKFAIRSVPGGGTKQEILPDEKRKLRALTDDQVLALADLGGKIESHYGGAPQDIEWCIASDTIYIVQARPITSLFPVPDKPAKDEGLRIYLSFGHVQMMTGPMPRLSRDIWRYFFPAGKGHAPGLDESPLLSTSMVEVASRIYIDVTPILRANRVRKGILAGLNHVYQDMARVAAVLVSRPGFIRGNADPGLTRSAIKILGPVVARVPFLLFVLNPFRAARIADNAFEQVPVRARARIESGKTQSARIRQVAVEFNAIFSSVRKSLSRLLAAVIAHRLLARSANGEWARKVRDQVDRLLRGLSGNVTTQMDLAVGDLSDLVRPHPELAVLLRDRPWAEIQKSWSSVEGGEAFAQALARFLERYGDRGASEIDVSRPRWSDNPSLLFRAITGGISSGEAQGHRRKYEAQIAEGEDAQKQLISAAKAGFFGFIRQWWIRRLCHVVRAGMGLREHPKFAIVRTLGGARREILAAGETLVKRSQIRTIDDVWHLGFEELATAVEDPSRDFRAEITLREEAFKTDLSRRPPVVMSSEGETPTLAEDRSDLPENAMSGTAASSGVVEGIARVVRDPDREVLNAGEILVAPFTDPGWTPLFVHAAGVVTEVGGLMTHGAVVAREYGIPAVVSVSNATERIKSGQRIRVDGTRGYVLVLESP